MNKCFKKILFLLLCLIIGSVGIKFSTAFASESDITGLNINISENTSEGYLVTCIFTGANNVKSILFPTWTESGGQDDIIWSEGTINGNVAKYRVSIADHNNESGVYNTHVYAIDKNDNHVILGGTSVSIAASPSQPENTTNNKMDIIDKSASGYTVKFTFSGNARNIYFPTWTENGGQDDIVWGVGNISGNTATYRVNTKDHNNESGTYNTHVYAEDSNGNLVIQTGTTIDIQSSSTPTTITCQSFDIVDKSASGYTVKCTFTGSVRNVLFPTWTENNGQDDIIWSVGDINNNTATYRVNIKDHNNESGTYNTHAYAEDSSGNLILLNGTTVEISSASSGTYKLTNMEISDQSSDYYTVKCTFSGIDAISSVVFPTWTENNGQDDIVWGEGNIAGNTVTFTVLSSLHNNEKGLYHTHIYVYDKKGEMTLVGGQNATLSTSNNNDNSNQSSSQLNITPKTDWRAKWIWNNSNGSENNVWMNFRKTINLSNVPSSLIANIAVDSRYFLYINDSLVVFDGGLKRGPSPTSGYYDSVDIASYLKSGNNTISVLVWYWGKDQSFSGTDSGHGGLLFEAISGDVQILSDSSWKVHRDGAYLNDTGSMQPNYRLSEYNIYYDARYETSGWQNSSFNDSSWSNATELGTGGCSPWNTLYKRPIPLFKNFGLKNYENSDGFVNHTTTTDENITVNIPYNAQFTPYLKVSAPAGKQIMITTENSFIGTPISTYVTKDGIQEFESFGWVNGEHVTYHIPAGVQILSLQYRETGYNSEFEGSFSCNDGFFNSLWTKSERTLYVTMRDSFMDCPDRERAQWWGDVTSEMNMLMYTMDSNSYLLYKKGVFNMLSYIDKNTNAMQTVVPISNDYYELPVQQLAGICGFETYYMYTGDRDLLASVYDASKTYINLWSMGGNGLVIYRGGSWDWLDWGDNIDRELLQNAWYYKALKSMKHIAEILGKNGDISAYDQRLNSIYNGFQNYWTGNGYTSGTVAHSDNRVNAIAVLSGLADSSKYPAILNNFITYTDTSPYMERYVLDALSEMGYMSQAQSRIKLRYGDMVNTDYSTLWEFWNKDDGTMNHAWSGGPLLTMSEYMAGIRPTEAGYNKYIVKPLLGDLTSIKCNVPSIKGNIGVVIDKTGNTFNLNLSSPASTTATVAIPRNSATPTVYYNNTVVFQNGQYVGNVGGLSYNSIDGDYIYFDVNSSSATNCNFKAVYN